MTERVFDFDIPIGAWVEAGVDWVQLNLTGVLDGIAGGLGWSSIPFGDGLLAMPPLLLAALIVTVAGWRVGWRFGLFALVAMALIFGMGIWQETVSTLALVSCVCTCKFSLIQ